jgi:uncharacterized protein
MDGIVRFVDRRAASGLDWLELEFFGGEPLAAWSVTRRLTTQLNQICGQHGVMFLGAITTNATLLDDARILTLAQNGISLFQITLDGPGELHNTRRRTSTGKGTFSQIWRALEMLKNSGHNIEVMLRIHFDATSAKEIAGTDFLPSVAKLVLNDQRFQIHFKPLEKWPGTHVGSVKPFPDHRSEAEALEHLLHEAEAAGIPSHQLPQTQKQFLPMGESGHVVCYAARANSFVIRSDGRISKCTVALDDERNVVGRIVPDGSLEIDHERHLPWLRGLITNDAQSLCCPANGFIWVHP